MADNARLHWLTRPPSAWFLAAPPVWMAGLLWMSTIPGTLSPEPAPAHWPFAIVPAVLQNLAHIPAYGALAWLWRWSLGRYLPPVLATAVAFTLAMFTGIADESIQATTPGRNATILDLGLNALGASLFLIAFEALRRHQSMRDIETRTGRAAR